MPIQRHIPNSSQPALYRKPRQNKHQSAHQSPKEGNPSTHLKITSIIHTAQQTPDHRSGNKCLRTPHDDKYDGRNPYRLPVLELDRAGVERGDEVHGAEEEQRPEDGEAPDVVAVVEVVGLPAVDGEWPVEAGPGGCEVVRGRGVGRGEGVEDAFCC